MRVGVDIVWNCIDRRQKQTKKHLIYVTFIIYLFSVTQNHVITLTSKLHIIIHCKPLLRLSLFVTVI